MYEARLEKMVIRPPTQFTKIKLVNNFSLESSGIRMHRSWKVGDGKFISLSKLELPDSISTILCNNTLNCKTALFATAQTKNKPPDLSKRFIGTSKNIYINRLFDCYEEGCVKQFLKLGNLINHLAAGKRQSLPERVSLRDAETQIYALKLEEVGQRELISVSLESTINTTNRTPIRSNLTEGWALPKLRKVIRLTMKQIEYLTNNFNDNIKRNMRWKPEAVATEMECFKDNGGFVFAHNKFLKPSQIRSYFSRLKSNRQKDIKVEHRNDGDIEAFKEEQAVDEVVQRRQLQHQVHSIDQLERATSSKRSASSIQITAKRPNLCHKNTS